MSEGSRSMADPNGSESASSASTLTGWVLRVNESLRDVADKETMQSSGQSGHSGSDEERKAVIQEDLPDSAPEEDAHHDHHQDVQDHNEFPCLFHSYLSRCANGQHCRFSHSIHADQVRVPAAKTRRGHARNRIKKRVTQHFNAANLYEVHEFLQQEAMQDSYAKELIRRHLTAIATSSTGEHLWL
eukprot:s167_g21.t1